jgi:hypothetical protein
MTTKRLERPKAALILVALMLLIAGTSPRSATEAQQPQPDNRMVSVPPRSWAYDSGWVEISPNGSYGFDHNLGGNVDDYVVDVQFWDITESGGDLGIHTRGFGADFSNHVKGVYWQDLTDTNLTLVSTLSNDCISAVRVRIRLQPAADYDSGWRSVNAGSNLSLSHNLGGDPDDYVVDMQFKSSNLSQGVNQLGYGGDDWGAGRIEGAFWHSLTATSIQVSRNFYDPSASAQVRVRIWDRPSPDYDSGWQSITDEISLSHDLGGPWNDFVVDMQMKDTDGAWGVNHRGYGGDQLSAAPTEEHGTYWTNLTSSRIKVHGGEDNESADQVRVRIWASRAPHYDSGWRPFDQGSGQTLTHNLRGTTFPYVMDVQYRDTDADGVSGRGVNQYYYGGDTWYNHGDARHVNSGVWWHSLTDESVFLYRFGDDYAANEVRVRLWIAPDADYDSGWQNIGTSLILNHNLGGDPDDYVVDLQFNDNVAAFPQGINHGRYGGDTYFENGATHRALGGYWQALDETSITVNRLGDASLIDAVRVRIWVNERFDYTGNWQTLATARSVHHDLGTCPDGLVVDLQFQSDGTRGVHNYYYGGNSLYYGGLVHYGAHWQALTGSSIELCRHANDNEVDQARVRLWTTPGCRMVVPLILRE